jgi:hypothetical protein
MGHLHERVPGIVAAQLALIGGAAGLREELHRATVPSEGTPVYDLDGQVLFERVRISETTYADLAVAPEFGHPLIAVTAGDWWEPERLVEQAAAALRKHKRKADCDYDTTRFVAYSFPKLAVQFLKGKEEVALIECFTGIPVPVGYGDGDDNFTRLPFKAGLDRAVARRRTARFNEVLETVPAELRRLRRFNDRIRLDDDWVRPILTRTTHRDLHYSGRDADHNVCYELRGQETNVWCVGASVQMVLDFYRYNYSQDRLAQDLGLGTKANPNGLSYSRDGDVVLVLENLTNKSLTASMNTTPTFAEYKSEIRANRPLISFIPGHSRSVAGYTETTSLIRGLNYQGLLVFDPWPPNAGVITRYENFNATTYRRTFSAHVTLT